MCTALEYAYSMLWGTLSWGVPTLLGDESLPAMKHKLLEPVSKYRLEPQFGGSSSQAKLLASLFWKGLLNTPFSVLENHPCW